MRKAGRPIVKRTQGIRLGIEHGLLSSPEGKRSERDWKERLTQMSHASSGLVQGCVSLT
jgi:hypothetical protein